MADIVNSIGLALDIVGVVLLFRFGLPSEVEKDGGGFLMLEGPAEEDVKKYERYRRIARSALFCLVLGFALQIVSNFL